MTNDDWFDWQLQMLFERFEYFAQILRSQLSIAESLFEEAQAWVFPAHADMDLRGASKKLSQKRRPFWIPRFARRLLQDKVMSRRTCGENGSPI